MVIATGASRGTLPIPGLKELEGNPGKRQLNDYEPLPPLSMLRCPNYLLPEAKKEWRRLAPALIDMGVLTIADAVPFAAYCTAFYYKLTLYQPYGWQRL